MNQQSTVTLARIYQPSGKVDYFRTAFWTIIAAMIIPFISMAYVYGIRNISMAQANFLVTLLYGLAIGGVMIVVVHMGNIRSVKVAALLTLFVALIEYYVHWAIWVVDVISPEDIGFTTYVNAIINLVSDPGVLWRLILKINEVGSWTIGKNGIPETGGLLWFFWICEALIIILLSLIFPASCAQRPFCEVSGNWVKKIKFKKSEYIENLKVLESQLLNKNYQSLKDLTFQADKNQSYSKVKLYHFTGENKYYIDFENTKVIVDDKGKTKNQYDHSFKMMEIDTSLAMELMNKGRV